MNKEIKANIPNDLQPWQIDAISHIEREYLAYKECYRRHIKDKQFECIVNDDDGKTKKLITDFGNPYGLFNILDEKIIPDFKVSYMLAPPKGYKYMTFCTMGVCAFLYYFMGYTDTDNKCTTDVPWKRHPISAFSQYTANQLVTLLKEDEMSKAFGIRFRSLGKIQPALTAAYEAHNGNLTIAAWKNSKGIGHITTIIGGKPDITGLVYLFAYPMTYNVGAYNGYMSLEDAFGGTEDKDINYYIVEKI